MYGIIAKLIIAPGKRDEMIAILKDSAANMPGCLSYVVARDAADFELAGHQVLKLCRVEHHLVGITARM